jgi:hypothetical protein
MVYFELELSDSSTASASRAELVISGAGKMDTLERAVRHLRAEGWKHVKVLNMEDLSVSLSRMLSVHPTLLGKALRDGIAYRLLPAVGEPAVVLESCPA